MEIDILAIMFKKLLYLSALIGCQFGTAQEYLPKSKGEIIRHTYYALSYLEDYEQAEWVHYMLTPEMLRGNTNRTDNFRADPKIFSGSAQVADYKNSGYDRGHLVPARDMRMNNLSMNESFYMSNMSPQSPSFNRGIWKTLEMNIRTWGSRDKIHIVTGGVLKNGLQKIGANGVGVPKYFYKIVYDPGKGKMIAFILPNQKGQNSLDSYVINVDKIEALTNIDFFPQLPNEIEERLESKVDIADWSFTIDKTYTPQKNNQISSSLRCNAIAKSTGAQCKIRTKNENGYCYVHQYQSPDYVKPEPSASGYVGRCNATTRKGTRCKRNASSGTRYCWQHQY